MPATLHRSTPARLLALVSALLIATALAAAPAAAAPPGTVDVVSGADTGPGSLRAAVAAANADPSIDTIRFDGGLVVALESSVTYTGLQALSIEGNGATISGASVTPDTDTWDGGLLVATGGADLTVERLTLALQRITVDGVQFHGVLVDGQSTTGYNTDDTIHHSCTDPNPVDADVAVAVNLSRTTITGAGRLVGYDISLATPVDATVSPTSFTDNGDTAPIVCTDGAQCGDDLGSEISDLDDGFDIDEAGAGDLTAEITRTTVDGNRDEDLDFDEEDDGSIAVAVERTEAAGNGDEACKASEEGEGSHTAALQRVTFTGSGNDAVEVEKADGGDVVVSVERATVTGTDGSGIKAVDADGVAVTLTRTAT